VALDGLNSTVSGVLRGSGHQKLGAAINFLGYVSLIWFGSFGEAGNGRGFVAVSLLLPVPAL